MSTLIRPPPVNPSKSAIENVLELTQLRDIDPDLFTNTRPLWHPPGARGIYGGAVIAQCLAAAQRTVPSNFNIHSMHCYFVLAGNATIPVIYHVERVRSGKSFATRTVQARQRGSAIFTVTMSFTREGSGGKKEVRHAVQMPDLPAPSEDLKDMRFQEGEEGPFQSQRIEILNHDSGRPEQKRTRQWVKARGTISDAGGKEAHLSALAYMSDSWFIGTVARVHRLWPGVSRNEVEDDDRRTPRIGMMVSLDHTIYFHVPKSFRADEWLFTEMESPWAGDGRGLVMQRIFTRDGVLVATCVQEGVVRLRQDGESKL